MSSNILELWEQRKHDDVLYYELTDKMHDTVGDREYSYLDEEYEEEAYFDTEALDEQCRLIREDLRRRRDY